MNRTLHVGVGIVLAAGLCTATVMAADANKSKDKIDDRTFVKKSGEINLAEVNLAMIARKQSTNPGVQKYAEHLLKDHLKSNEQLNQIASKQNVPVAAKMDQKHTALADKLSAMTGPSFDREFLEHMVKGHKQAIKLFENEAKNGQDAAVKAYAEQTLPTLREHLREAQQLVPGGNPAIPKGASR